MTTIIKLFEVVKRTGLSKSSIYEKSQEGKFPKPVKLSERSSGWVESEVDAWIESRIDQRDGEVSQ